MNRARITGVAAVAAIAQACAGGYAAKRHSARSAPPGAYDGAAESVQAGSSAPSSAMAPESAPIDRPGLGTSFGENLYSRVEHRSFERASSAPFAQVALHYNDAEGVYQQARYRGVDLAPIRAHTPSGGISIALVDERGGTLPGVSGADRTYVIGRDGDRYGIVIRNDTGGRYEVVASVDGLDVIDGQPAGMHKRGYLLAPYSTLRIDGFRTSTESVAAFRFGAVADSYASRTGDDRNVGVIGAAFFAERGSQWTSDELHRRETADPFPNRYAVPPGW